MKKFLSGLKNLISRHKLLTIISFLALIIIIVMFYIFFNILIGGADKYGDRLNGIDKVTISSKEQKELKTFLEDKDEVTAASVRIQGKIIYIHIEVKKDVSLDKAKEIANETLGQLADDEKAFYDLGFSLTQEQAEGEEDQGFVVTGTKNAKLDYISWIKS